MKIVGVGIDIVELKRIKNVKQKSRLAEFFFTKEELSDLKNSTNSVEFLGSRIALKEAIIKSSPNNLHYHDFILYKEKNKMKVRFVDKKYKKYKVFLSLTHEFKYAIGYAIMTL